MKNNLKLKSLLGYLLQENVFELRSLNDAIYESSNKREKFKIADEDIPNLMKIILQWYNDHRKVEAGTIEMLRAKYPSLIYKGLAYRAVVSDYVANDTGRSWSKDLKSFRHFLDEISPQLNGAEVYNMTIDAFDIGELCGILYYSYNQTRSELKSIYNAGEVIVTNPISLDWSDFVGYVLDSSIVDD